MDIGVYAYMHTLTTLNIESVQQPRNIHETTRKKLFRNYDFLIVEATCLAAISEETVYFYFF